MKETGLCCGIKNILVGLALVLKPSQGPERQSNKIFTWLLSILQSMCSDSEILHSSILG